MASASDSSGATPTMQRHIVFVACDGTWSGDAAGTTGNIKLMAECIAGTQLANRQVFTVGNPVSVVGTYFDGVGLGGTPDLAGFIEYIQDGATANDIRNRCVEVYRFIVEYCTKDSEVWLLGFSRGAFTVRSVAGLINNFGILDKTKFQLDPVPTDSRAEPDPVCAEVYRMYRSRDKQFHPDADYPKEFKGKYCLDLGTRPAVRFMGLLDTVGSLGVPTINAGYGLEFLFYDQVVSEQVENVYQALAAHDVFFGFDPCFVRRERGTKSGVTLEVWFPGAHWDLGRQRFVPFRTTGGLLERIAHSIIDVANLLGVNIEPTLECSVEPLKWMLTCMRQTDPSLFDDAGYDQAVAHCMQAFWQDNIPFVPQALKKNALEELNNRFFHSLSPLSASLALRDRQIPEYSDANFIAGPNGMNNEAAFVSPGSGFMSKAYNTFKALRPAGVIWVPYGQDSAGSQGAREAPCRAAPGKFESALGGEPMHHHVSPLQSGPGCNWGQCSPTTDILGAEGAHMDADEIVHPNMEYLIQEGSQLTAVFEDRHDMEEVKEMVKELVLATLGSDLAVDVLVSAGCVVVQFKFKQGDLSCADDLATRLVTRGANLTLVISNSSWTWEIAEENPAGSVTGFVRDGFETQIIPREGCGVPDLIPREGCGVPDFKDLQRDLCTWDVFVCHAGPDKLFALTLKKYLPANLRCFVDKESLRVSDNAKQCMKDAINATDVAVVLLSRAFFRSKDAKEELVRILRNHRDGERTKVVPVFLGVTVSECKQLAKKTGQGLEKICYVTGICHKHELSTVNGRPITRKQTMRKIIDRVISLTGES